MILIRALFWGFLVWAVWPLELWRFCLVLMVVLLLALDPRKV